MSGSPRASAQHRAAALLRRLRTTRGIDGDQEGFDPLLVQQQAGHEHASTVSVYASVSPDYETRLLRAGLDKVIQQARQQRRMGDDQEDGRPLAAAGGILPGEHQMPPVRLRPA